MLKMMGCTDTQIWSGVDPDRVVPRVRQKYSIFKNEENVEKLKMEFMAGKLLPAEYFVGLMGELGEAEDS